MIQYTWKMKCSNRPLALHLDGTESQTEQRNGCQTSSENKVNTYEIKIIIINHQRP